MDSELKLESSQANWEKKKFISETQKRYFIVQATTHNPLILIGEILKANNRVLVWFQMMIVMVYVWMIYYFL